MVCFPSSCSSFYRLGFAAAFLKIATRDDLHEDVVNKGEEELLDEVPDHGSEEVEDVVDGLAEVALPQQAVQVHLDLGELGCDVHLRHLAGDKVSYIHIRHLIVHSAKGPN